MPASCDPQNRAQILPRTFAHAYYLHCNQLQPRLTAGGRTPKGNGDLANSVHDKFDECPTAGGRTPKGNGDSIGALPENA